ncbi:metallophosphoesterase [Peptoniphilus equinus]|uniref:Metallophosphoesterase n=1 Tax=Peptoniphilus equinus TaxID=3016343 RepID=A0ABY7QUH2_9FIRM|nr:metallophosphoesterase [Peptoniphilus equinus]WBW49675.1 metallophosphoesterase [Peptoniphilus equinus]
MIYAIGDLHFDPYGDKPMDVFGPTWANHKARIIEDWKAKVTDDDVVLVAGDISWALKLDEALADLKTLDTLPGTKALIRGNHDYWWSSLAKMNDLKCRSLVFIQNNAYTFGDVSIVGTRGWISRDMSEFTADDEKIYKRELIRLENSLKAARAERIIAMIHYPPYNMDFSNNDFSELLAAYHVDTVVYGHLHAEGHRQISEVPRLGVNYQCVSADYVDFKLQEVTWNGKLK